MPKIQSQIFSNEDAFVFSIFVRRNVGATKTASVETFDDAGNPTVETRTVDASRPDSSAFDAALNAVVASLSASGFSARANVSPLLLGEISTDAETAKLVVDVALEKTSSVPAPEISSDVSPTPVPTDAASESLNATEV